VYDERFGHTTYEIREKPFKLFGGIYQIYDPAGNVVFNSKKAAFKMKEDVRLYADEEMTQELIVILARQAIDFSASYDVVDPRANERVGVLRRKGMKSILKDEWILCDSHEQEIGTIKEDSPLMAGLRRLMSFVAINLIPQSYAIEVGGAPAGTLKQNFNPFLNNLKLDFSADAEGRLDRRLGIAAALMLVAIEAKQQ
jgi:hypothetical protein